MVRNINELNLVKEFSSSSIQMVIDTLMKKEDFLDFLSKMIQEETSDDFAFILNKDASHNKFLVGDEQEGGIARLGLFLCFREMITIGQLKNFLSTDTIDNEEKLKILETIFALDLRFLATPLKPEGNTERISLSNLTLLKKEYLRDFIPRIYVQRDVVGVSSYKNIDNVSDEYLRILGRLKTFGDKKDTTDKQDEIRSFINSTFWNNDNGESFLDSSTEDARIFFTINENIGKILLSPGIFTLSTVLNNEPDKISTLKDIISHGSYSTAEIVDNKGVVIRKAETRKFSILTGDGEAASCFGFQKFVEFVDPYLMEKEKITKEKFSEFLGALIKGTINY